MTKTELNKILSLNPEQNIILTICVETGIDGGWEVAFKDIYTIKTLKEFLNNCSKIISKSEELDKNTKVFTFNILNEDVAALSFNDFIKNMDITLISEEEATILNKYNAFCTDGLLDLVKLEDLLQYNYSEE